MSRRGASPTADPAWAALRRERSIQWWAIWIVFLAVVCIGWRVKQAQIAAREQQLRSWEQACQPLAALDAEVATYPARQSALDEREALIDQVHRESAPARWLTTVGRAAAAEDVFVQELRLSLENTPQMTVRGISRGDAAARRFVQSLTSSGVFAGVELEWIESPDRVAADAREFAAQGQMQ
jgi:Tfp pilus assembly protein PilN